MKQNERGKFEMKLRFWRKKEKKPRRMIKEALDLADYAMWEEAMRLDQERLKEREKGRPFDSV